MMMNWLISQVIFTRDILSLLVLLHSVEVPCRRLLLQLVFFSLSFVVVLR